MRRSRWRSASRSSPSSRSSASPCRPWRCTDGKPGTDHVFQRAIRGVASNGKRGLSPVFSWCKLPALHGVTSFVKRFRHLGFALCLAFALLLGERGALLHELGHGLQRMHAPAKDGAPAGDTCDKCFAFSQLSGPAPSAAAALSV